MAIDYAAVTPINNSTINNPIQLALSEVNLY